MASRATEKERPNLSKKQVGVVVSGHEPTRPDNGLRCLGESPPAVVGEKTVHRDQ